MSEKSNHELALEIQQLRQAVLTLVKYGTFYLRTGDYRHDKVDWAQVSEWTSREPVNA